MKAVFYTLLSVSYLTISLGVPCQKVIEEITLHARTALTQGHIEAETFKTIEYMAERAENCSKLAAAQMPEAVKELSFLVDQAPAISSATAQTY